MVKNSIYHWVSADYRMSIDIAKANKRDVHKYYVYISSPLKDTIEAFDSKKDAINYKNKEKKRLTSVCNIKRW